MTTVINTNIASLRAQNNLRNTATGLDTAMERLSSGKRINSAKDDAAGLGIATRMQAQIEGIRQAIRNTNDAISLAQTAEGAMQETTNVLLRMRVLAVQSANGTNSTGDRASINDEVTQLKAELDRIAEKTEFNGLVIIDGAFSAASAAIVFQVGPNEGSTLSVQISGVSSATLGVNNVNVSTVGGASTAINAIDGAIDKIVDSRANLGAVQNRLEYTIANLTSVATNLDAAKSRIVDADFAAETAALAKWNILNQAGTVMLAQANSSPQSVLQLLQG